MCMYKIQGISISLSMYQNILIGYVSLVTHCIVKNCTSQDQNPRHFFIKNGVDALSDWLTYGEL